MAMTQEQLQGKGPRLLIMTRYGKLVFSEGASQSLGLSEKTCVKFGFNDTFSTYHLKISASDNGGVLKLKTSGIYYYTICVDMLRVLGLYSSVPTIYELVKEDESNGDSVFRLDKIITIKDPKIGSVFTNKDELRSVLAMINAKI